jgi:murein DD-endopeptidase MepM/ murein hydrolase activator NlpD
LSQKITFMIIPEGHNKVLSRTFSSRLIKFVLIILSLWVILLVIMTINYSSLSIKAAKGAMLEEENDNLRRYIAKVVDIEESFKKNRELTARLAEMAGVDLEEFDGQPRIDLQALAKEYPESVSIDSQLAKNRLALSPQELARIRIPQGRPLYGWITRSFEVDSEKESEKHTGIDFAVKRGTSVAATASGVVVFAGWDKILGNMVIINHDDNYQTLYGHNDKLLVEKGQEVLKGDIIAFSGNTGRSSAPHLHYEIRKDGEPIDPTPYLE